MVEGIMSTNLNKKMLIVKLSIHFFEFCIKLNIGSVNMSIWDDPVGQILDFVSFEMNVSHYYLELKIQFCS